MNSDHKYFELWRLRAAALLVTLGIVGLLEHPYFSIINAFQIPPNADQGLLIPPHAKIHFFMAAVYSLIALALILFIAWTGLLHGRRTAWYAILGVFIVGGGWNSWQGAFFTSMVPPSMLPLGFPDP
jgi:hypothetical protein